LSTLVFLFSIFPYHPIQNLTESELAKMPSCNLIETIYNKWLQQSGNRGDVYVATIDDFVRAFIQVLRY
jgi:hypothetical protein